MENQVPGESLESVLSTGPDGSSKSIAKISLALSKAQGEIQHAIKDATNPHFNSKFATLSSVLDACRLPLSKNELSVFQKIEGEHGKLYIVTLLAHSSGEWVSSRLPLIINKNDMQGLGSAITYGRRYGLSAMVGVGQEDDDGNSAGQAQGKTDHKPPANQKKKDEKPKPPTLDQQLSMGMKKNGWTLDQLNDYVGQVYKVKPGQKLHDEKKIELIKVLNKFGPELAFQELETPRENGIKNHAPSTEVEMESMFGLCMDRNITEDALRELITEGYNVPYDQIPQWVADDVMKFLSSPDASQQKIGALTKKMVESRQR